MWPRSLVVEETLNGAQPGSRERNLQAEGAAGTKLVRQESTTHRPREEGKLPFPRGGGWGAESAVPPA